MTGGARLCARCKKAPASQHGMFCAKCRKRPGRKPAEEKTAATIEAWRRQAESLERDRKFSWRTGRGPGIPEGADE